MFNPEALTTIIPQTSIPGSALLAESNPATASPHLTTEATRKTSEATHSTFDCIASAFKRIFLIALLAGAVTALIFAPHTIVVALAVTFVALLILRIAKRKKHPETIQAPTSQPPAPLRQEAVERNRATPPQLTTSSSSAVSPRQQRLPEQPVSRSEQTQHDQHKSAVVERLPPPPITIQSVAQVVKPPIVLTTEETKLMDRCNQTSQLKNLFLKVSHEEIIHSRERLLDYMDEMLHSSDDVERLEMILKDTLHRQGNKEGDLKKMKSEDARDLFGKWIDLMGNLQSKTSHEKFHLDQLYLEMLKKKNPDKYDKLEVDLEAVRAHTGKFELIKILSKECAEGPSGNWTIAILLGFLKDAEIESVTLVPGPEKQYRVELVSQVNKGKQEFDAPIIGKVAIDLVLPKAITIGITTKSEKVKDPRGKMVDYERTDISFPKETIGDEKTKILKISGLQDPHKTTKEIVDKIELSVNRKIGFMSKTLPLKKSSEKAFLMATG